MRRTENPENVVRIHKVPLEDGQIRLTSNGITSVIELIISARAHWSVSKRRIIIIFSNGAVCTVDGPGAQLGAISNVL